MALSDEELLAVYTEAIQGGQLGQLLPAALQAVARAVAKDCARMLDDAEQDGYDTGDGDSTYEYKFWSSGAGMSTNYASTPGDYLRTAYGVPADK